jgi:hypothetical protein
MRTAKTLTQGKIAQALPAGHILAAGLPSPPTAVRRLIARFSRKPFAGRARAAQDSLHRNQLEAAS